MPYPRIFHRTAGFKAKILALMKERKIYTCEYFLILQELVKYSKRLGEDCSDLQKALELFLGVPNRATDNKFIASIEGYRGNIYKLGRLLTHDWFTVTDTEGKTKERYLFLFKARILICKVKRVADDRSVFVLKDIIKVSRYCFAKYSKQAVEPSKRGRRRLC